MNIIKNVWSNAITLSVLGYLVLLSYTWPYGFVPQVDLQSLPIVLLGFLFIMLLVLLSLSILFIPFWLLNNEDFLRDSLYGEPFGDLDGRFKDKSLSGPMKDILNDLIKEIGIISLPFIFMQIVVILAVCFYSWYIFSSSVLIPSQLLIYSPLLWLSFRSLVGLLRSKNENEAIFYIIGVIFFFILVPMLPSTGHKAMGPNMLAKTALSITSSGGEIPVEIYPRAPIDSFNKRIEAKLIFYDGNKAWFVPCKESNVRNIQIVYVESLKYLSNSSCSQSQ